MSTFHQIAIAIIIVISSARLTRIGVYDGFPPVKWVRDKVFDWTDKNDRRRGWQAITWCSYCFSFWPTLVVVLSGYYSNWHLAWWIINGSLAASYLAAIFVVKDREPSDEDEDDN
jgi:hypothetical protein